MADQHLLDRAGIKVRITDALGNEHRAAIHESLHLETMTAEHRETFVSREQEADIHRRAAAAKRDIAMLGDSGYDRVEADHYCTPQENVDCLIQHVNINTRVWEPAAGKGDISERLTEFGCTVVSSDIIDYGFDHSFFVGDFLQRAKLPMIPTGDGKAALPRAIVTNPPYFGDMPEQFIRHALKLMEPQRGQVAMFLRNEYDCSKGRMSLFSMQPFAKKVVVTKRPRWVEGSTGSPRHNYAWFVWDFAHEGPPQVLYSHPDFAPSPVKP